MYFIVRDDNKQMAKNGLILSVILTIVAIILVGNNECYNVIYHLK